MQQIYGNGGNTGSKDTKKNEDSLVSTIEPQKYIKRGQILRLAKRQADPSSQRGEEPEKQASLTRVESKKELQPLQKEADPPCQKSQHHLVEEDLIIHENIHDSSCTPLTNQSVVLKEPRQESSAALGIEQKPQEISPMKEERGQESSRQRSAIAERSDEKTTQQQTETQISSNGRVLNHSANAVKSPIATSTSFKSQNSQQAGQNHDEVIVSICNN